MTDGSDFDLGDLDDIDLDAPVGPVLFYNETVIDHFMKPRNVGEMSEADGYSLIGDGRPAAREISSVGRGTETSA